MIFNIRSIMMDEERKKQKYEYDQKYFKENYTQIKLSVPNAEAEELNTFLKEHGIKSKAGFIREAIKEKMEHYETNK